MEEVNREIVKGYGKRLSHHHYFSGSGIPKFDTVETTILNGLGIYPSKPRKSYLLKDSITYSLRVKNEFAGHKVPTGDPERFFTIIFILKNQKGDTLSVQNEKIGEHWEWHPIAKKVSDNNLLPNEERTYTFSYKAVKKEKLTLHVIVNKHRLNQKSADYNKLKSNYPLFINLFDEEYSIRIQ